MSSARPLPTPLVPRGASSASASAYEPILPAPEIPVGPPLVPAEAPAPATQDEWKPDLDCATFEAGPAPNLRFLCDLAMGKRPAASLVDGSGYAYVAFYTTPSHEGGDVKMRKRVCGPDAATQLGPLLDEIRLKLSYGEEDPWVSCRGLVCDVRAEGEWSTPQRLYFRRGANGIVLEAWTRVELALIPPEMAAARVKWIDQGRWALAGKGCGR